MAVLVTCAAAGCADRAPAPGNQGESSVEAPATTSGDGRPVVLFLGTSLTAGYGQMIRRLRGVTNRTMNKEPKWRHSGDRLTTGYQPRWGN